MHVDNVVTWECAFMVFILVVLFEIDFSHMLIMEIHERVFKSTTTYPFPFLIFLMLGCWSVSLAF